MDKQNTKTGAGKNRGSARPTRGARTAKAALVLGMALSVGAFAESPSQNTLNQTTDGQASPASPTPSGSPPGVRQVGEVFPNPAPNTRNSAGQSGQSAQAQGSDQQQMQGSQGTQENQTQENQSNQASQQQSQQGTQPDNTGRNKADQPTAEDQGNSRQDIELTQRIRRELMQADNLSTNAKNVKIITENGKVTIRGPVDSQQEKATIMAIVQKAAGQAQVTDQLEPKNR